MGRCFQDSTALPLRVTIPAGKPSLQGLRMRNLLVMIIVAVIVTVLAVVVALPASAEGRAAAGRPRRDRRIRRWSCRMVSLSLQPRAGLQFLS